MTKVLDIYLRLSELRQEDMNADGQSKGLAEHERLLRDFVARLSATVGQVLTENDIQNGEPKPASAYKRRKIALPNGKSELRVIRPEFRRLLDRIEAKQSQGFVAIDLDRAVRDPRDLEDLIDITASAGANVRSLSGSLQFTDGGTDSEITLARVMVAMGNKASRDTGRRVSAARLRKAYSGENGGGRRGYGFLPDGVTVDEDEAKELRWMADQVLRNVSLAHIALDLNERAVSTVTGVAWTAQAVKEVLSKPRCAGILVYKGEEASRLPGDPILDEETWTAVKAAMNSEFVTWIDRWGHESTAPRRRTNNVGSIPRWLGAGIYLCVCGTPMETQDGKSRATTYRCSTKRKPAGSVHTRRNAAAVDDLVASRLIARMAMPDAAAVFIPTAPEVDVKALRRQASVLRVQLAKWDTDRAEVGDARWRTQTRRITAELTGIEQQVAAATVSSPLTPLTDTEGVDKVAAAWEAMSLGSRRAAIGAAMIVTILPAPRRPGFVASAISITGLDGTPWPELDD